MAIQSSTDHVNLECILQPIQAHINFHSGADPFGNLLAGLLKAFGLHTLMPLSFNVQWITATEGRCDSSNYSSNTGPLPISRPGTESWTILLDQDSVPLTVDRSRVAELNPTFWTEKKYTWSYPGAYTLTSILILTLVSVPPKSSTHPSHPFSRIPILILDMVRCHPGPRTKWRLGIPKDPPHIHRTCEDAVALLTVGNGFILYHNSQLIAANVNTGKFGWQNPTAVRVNLDPNSNVFAILAYNSPSGTDPMRSHPQGCSRAFRYHSRLGHRSRCFNYNSEE
ncbi:hypothetical protein BD779DRAFT_1469113 [Infundibulicybe gibba]|nr:hypothetical protein BD779DRAFT_1469113 [Infundibulicybe gibba]